MQVSRAKFNMLTAAALAAACLLSLCSCGSARTQGLDRPEGGTVLRVGDYTVTQDEYDYYLNNHISADGQSGDEAKKSAETDLRRNAALVALAAENELSLTNDERKKAEESLDAAVEKTGGDEAFDSGLAEYSMTRGLYLYLSELSLLEISLRSYMTDEVTGSIKADDATVEADIKENFTAAKQILIANDKGDDVDANRQLAENIAAELDAGGDFDALCAEYGEDANMDAVYGRYFTHGMFPESFEQTAAALDIGERSGVVESDVGFHIILRMPIDDGYVNDNFETLRYYFLNRRFNEELEAKAESLSAEWEK